MNTLVNTFILVFEKKKNYILLLSLVCLYICYVITIIILIDISIKKYEITSHLS
jgi:hypothetical protein